MASNKVVVVLTEAEARSLAYAADNSIGEPHDADSLFVHHQSREAAYRGLDKLDAARGKASAELVVRLTPAQARLCLDALRIMRDAEVEDEYRPAHAALRLEVKQRLRDALEKG